MVYRNACVCASVKMVYFYKKKKALSYLEDIKSGNSVNIGLLVSSVDLGSLFVNGRKERGQEFELKALYSTDDVESKLN